MKHKNYAYLLFLITTLILGVTNVFGFGGSSNQATINKKVKYTLNGNPILTNDSTVIYNGTYYVSAEALAKALGFNVTTQNNQVTITSSGSMGGTTDGSTGGTTGGSTAENPLPTQTLTGTIVAIDFAANRITVVPEKKPNATHQQTEIYITPNTVIRDGQTNQAYTIQNLDTNQTVTVTYTTISTKSIPPQTRNQASEIIVTPTSLIQPRS